MAYGKGKTIEPIQLRRFLSSNIKVRRQKLGLTQEKLAELMNISVQMINTIEGCRAWVSDKTLVNLADALGVEVYQLFTPVNPEDNGERHLAFSRRLQLLKQELAADIAADLESRFAPLIKK